MEAQKVVNSKNGAPQEVQEDGLVVVVEVSLTCTSGGHGMVSTVGAGSRRRLGHNCDVSESPAKRDPASETCRLGTGAPCVEKRSESVQRVCRFAGHRCQDEYYQFMRTIRMFFKTSRFGKFKMFKFNFRTRNMKKYLLTKNPLYECLEDDVKQMVDRWLDENVTNSEVSLVMDVEIQNYPKPC